MKSMDPHVISERMTPWLESDPLNGFDLDPATRAFCDDALRWLSDAAVLAEKLRRELGRGGRWRPVGRVLIVVSEADVLGTVFAMVACCLTGNRMRVKARLTGELAAGLASALGLDGDAFSVRDWAGAEQDDAAVLDGIDAVLLAGPEALVRRYRRVASPQVRLVEFGPKHSLAVVGALTTAHDVPSLAEAIWRDTALFAQGVCSAPQIIHVDSGAPVDALHAELLRLADRQPRLSTDARLASRVAAEAVRLRSEPEARVDWHPSGWCVTLDAGADGTGLPGVHLRVGSPVDALADARTRWGRALQTLGVFGVPGAVHDRCVAGFSRVCAIGRMHERGPLAPHDGRFELPALVDFVDDEVRAVAGGARVFVTGATGFIGRHVARALRDRGARVTALARPESRGRVPTGCALVVGDITAPDGWRAALADHDAVLHLAASYAIGPVSSHRMAAINIHGTRAVLDEAIAAGVPRIVHVSSTAALGATTGDGAGEGWRHDGVFRSVYEETKHIAHGIALRRMALGAPVKVAIPGGAFGPGDGSALARTIEAAATGKLPFQVRSAARFTLCHVARLVDGLLAVLDHGPAGEDFILAGEAADLPSVLAHVCHLAGRRPPRALPGRWLRPVARVCDPVARLTGVEMPISREALRVLADGDYVHVSSKARRRLGWDAGDWRVDMAPYVRSLIAGMPCATG